MKLIKLFLLIVLLIAFSIKSYARVHEYRYVETYCQYTPILFVLCSGLFDIESKHEFAPRVINLGTTILCQNAMTYPIKWSVKEGRPDGSAKNSFPSGHTAATFASAEMIRMEYGWGWGAVFYANAVFTGTMRVVHKRHWWWDTAAGAVIGIGSAHVGKMLSDKINLALFPNSFTLTYNF